MPKYTYKIRVQPMLPPALYGSGVRSIATDRLVNAVEGLAIRSITDPSGDGSQIIDVEFQGDDDEALNRLAAAVQNLGYSWLEATATEWATEALRGAALVGSGSTVVGVKSGDPGLGLLLGLLGSIVGAFIGSQIEREKVIFQLHRTTEGWKLYEITPEAQPVNPQLGWA